MSFVILPLDRERIQARLKVLKARIVETSQAARARPPRVPPSQIVDVGSS